MARPLSGQFCSKVRMGTNGHIGTLCNRRRHRWLDRRHPLRARRGRHPVAREHHLRIDGSRSETTRMARVVMAYTFADVDSGEEIVAKVAGQGLDAGDKAPYKAMTGALKYALLQSFLLATGDDPEDERLDARFTCQSRAKPSATAPARSTRMLKRVVAPGGEEVFNTC
jgi:hypothetical protein